MTRRNQLRLIFHGGLIMVISMMVETPGLWYAFHHGTDDLVRLYLRQAHTVLMATGIWLIATGMTLPLLELEEKGMSMLVWSLVISAYTFMLAVAVFIAGLWHYNLDPKFFPDQIHQLRAMSPYLQWTNISFLFVSGVTSLSAGWLLIRGSYKAVRHSILEQVH